MDKADQERLKAIQARVKELEAETAKWEAMQNAIGREMDMPLPAVFSTYMSIEEIFEADARSVYVGNVDYGASAEELAQHFQGCGEINRVTILCDKFSGNPKGHAYVEFADRESVANSLALQCSFFRERQLKVSAKRTNRPGISTTNRFHTGKQESPMFRGFSSGYPDIDAVKLVSVHRQCFQ